MRESVALFGWFLPRAQTLVHVLGCQKHVQWDNLSENARNLSFTLPGEPCFKIHALLNISISEHYHAMSKIFRCWSHYGPTINTSFDGLGKCWFTSACSDRYAADETRAVSLKPGPLRSPQSVSRCQDVSLKKVQPKKEIRNGAIMVRPI